MSRKWSPEQRAKFLKTMKQVNAAKKRAGGAKPKGRPPANCTRDAVLLLRRAIAAEVRVGKRLTTPQLYVQLALNVLEEGSGKPS